MTKWERQRREMLAELTTEFAGKTLKAFRYNGDAIDIRLRERRHRQY